MTGRPAAAEPPARVSVAAAAELPVAAPAEPSVTAPGGPPVLAPGERPVRGETERPVMVASDLDRTLIYSAAALELAVPDPQAPRLLCVEVYRSRPLSYLTETAAELLRDLTDHAVFVPVTTRTREQYHRIRLPGRPSRYAICANGGRLLVDGVSDPEWERRVAQALVEGCAPLPEIQERLRRTADPAWLLKERTAEDLFSYLVVDRAAFPAEWATELAGWAGERGWTVSVQGRKVYLVPRPLTKSAAVAEVARRTGAGKVLAAGDSLLDADLLEGADRGWRPGHGELAATGWTAPGVVPLSERGARCGEEILRAMLAHSRPTAPRGAGSGDDAAPQDT